MQLSSQPFTLPSKNRAGSHRLPTETNPQTLSRHTNREGNTPHRRTADVDNEKSDLTCNQILKVIARSVWEKDGNKGEPPAIPTVEALVEYDAYKLGSVIYPLVEKLNTAQEILGKTGPIYQTPELREACDRIIDTVAAEDNFKRTLFDTVAAFGFVDVLIADFAERIERLHSHWQAVRDRGEKKIPHILEPIIREWLKWLIEHNAKHITAKLDKIRPVSIIKNPMGSIREISFTDSGNAQLREFATPERTSQVNPDQMRLGFNDEPPSILPDIMPLEVPNPDGIKPTTKGGAVSHVVRIFYEALMALEPHERASDIVFRLGDLIDYLNPDGKFHRSTQLPYIIDALEILHVHATLPWIDDTGAMRKWRPVWVKSPLSMDSQNDAPVHMRVEVPPDARQGYMIVKFTHRMLGKKSDPQLNAYHTISWLWDKHATVKGKLIDPTRPIDRRNEKGEIVGADRVPIPTARGKPITNLYHDRVIAQGDREDNPAADRYPVLSKNDLIAACMPKATTTNIRVLWQRAKKYWEGMESQGIIRIKPERNGWRIFPSQEHLAAYRGVKKSAQKKA